MSSIITNVNLLFTALIGWVGDIAETLTASGNEILLIFAVLPLAFLGVRMFKKLIHARG